MPPQIHFDFLFFIIMFHSLFVKGWNLNLTYADNRLIVIPLKSVGFIYKNEIRNNVL